MQIDQLVVQKCSFRKQKKILLVFLLLLTGGLAIGQRTPNVVLILADDMGYGDSGCYGQQLISTPNIDQLAREGIRFTQFYAGAPVCAPSRSSLMTGQHTGHTPIRGNYEVAPEGQLALPDSAVTIAQLFKKAGYVTGDFGKWGLGYVGTSGDPNKKGFDYFFGYNCQALAHNYFPDHLWNNDQRIAYPDNPSNEKIYSADLIQEKALSFIQDHSDTPFFLFLSYTLPHAALQLPKGDSVFEMYKKQFNEQPRAILQPWNGKGYEPQAYPHAAYAAMVSRLDTYVGALERALKKAGIYEQTMIIFTSDNGPHAEGGNDPKFFNSSGGYRGMKRDLYEGGILEPMIVSWPGVIQKGLVTAQPAAFWDLMPTFGELIHEPVPANVDGLSLLPLLTGKGKQKQHDYLYWEFHENGGSQAVRMGNWKAIRLQVNSGKPLPVELYNLKADPAELINVAGHYPEILIRMEKIIRGAHTDNLNFPFGGSN